MNVDDMVGMMMLLDADGDGTVTRDEFAVYYKRLKNCSDAEYEAVWREIDMDGDGTLTLNELCRYYGIDTGECAQSISEHKGLDDDKILEALQLQSLLNEVRQKQQMQQKAHASRLAALSALADEMSDEEAVPSPTVVTTKISLEEITRQSKRRGELAPHFYT